MFRVCAQQCRGGGAPDRQSASGTDRCALIYLPHEEHGRRLPTEYIHRAVLSKTQLQALQHLRLPMVQRL